MKKLGQLLMFGLVMCGTLMLAFSDELRTDLYGVDITNDSNDGTSGNFYSLFNNYFGLQGANAYTSSNDVFNDFGVNPNKQWTTSGSELLFVNRIASYGNNLIINSSDGNTNYLVNIGDRISFNDGLTLDFELWTYNSSSERLFAWFSDPSMNADGDIHMVALEVTGLYNDTFNTVYDSVYMMGWEDMSSIASENAPLFLPSDKDYNDMFLVMTNSTSPNAPTPEPATLLIFLTGAGLVSTRYLRKKKQS